MPRAGCRKDQHREAVATTIAELEEQAGGKAWRRPGIRLRFILIGHDGVEDMRAEARLRGVAGVPVLVAEQRVQPAVGPTALLTILNHLSASLIEVELIEIDRQAAVARQTTQESRAPLRSGLVEDIQPDRTIALGRWHRR